MGAGGSRCRAALVLPLPLTAEGAALYRDTRFVAERVAGLAAVAAWVKTPTGGVLDPDFLGALDRYTSALESDPRVGPVVGLPSVMVPSLFAILVMFLLMRLTGIPLDVATIPIATTVLGATEKVQIHFFYHVQERRHDGTCEQALAHAIRVAGSAIFFATLINAGGFLALALSPLPPMRQFGVLTACAFALSMLADFTALPATLWIVSRERPDRVEPA